MTHTLIYDTFGVALAVIFGVTAIVGVLVRARRDSAFLSGTYSKWLATGVAWAFISPFIYLLRTPPQITFYEAAFLQVRSVGWTWTLMSYLTLLGLLVGGLVAKVLRSARPPTIQPEHSAPNNNDL